MRTPAKAPHPKSLLPNNTCQPYLSDSYDLLPGNNPDMDRANPQHLSVQEHRATPIDFLTMSTCPAAGDPLVTLPCHQAVKDRFMAINNARLGRVHAALGHRQRDFLDLLPLFFHLNHPLLPGYQCENPPAGIVNYSPTSHSLEAARRLTKRLITTGRTHAKPDLLAIYLMGSTGSIAHSSDSDFDIWVCHRRGLSQRQLQDLQKKAEKVRSWAASLGLETHFFVLNDEDFRDGAHRRLSAEDSGSVQHQLLVEEFYRTGLLVAGCYPVWWLVPPEHEQQYGAYVAALRRDGSVMAGDVLDFGGVDKLLAKEFFGGALWQLSKAIDSPYKSALKMLLVEAYASEYPNVKPLSLRFKQAVYDGTTEIDELDP